MNKATTLGLGSLIGAAVAIGIPMITAAHAQTTAPPPAGPRGVNGAALQTPNGGFNGAPPVVVNDPTVLYIVRGNAVYRIEKESLRVSGSVSLPPVGRPGNR